MIHILSLKTAYANRGVIIWHSGIHVFTVFALCLLHQHMEIWDYRIWSSYLEATL